MVQSVAKGYQMLAMIYASLPISIQALWQLVLAVIALSILVSIVKYTLGGD